MPIDRLSSTSSLLAALRAEMARKTEKPSRKDASATARSREAPSGGRRDVNALRRELTEILRDVPPDDQPAMDAVRPRVVRAVLLWEFGAELREHPEWQPMIERLVATLQTNDAHRDSFSKLIRDLQS